MWSDAHSGAYDNELRGGNTILKWSACGLRHVARLRWIAFASAIVVWALTPFLVMGSDPAIILLPVPALLLVVGGLRRSDGDRSYARACLALGILMATMLVLVVLPVQSPTSLPRTVEMMIFGMWLVHAPTAVGAGIVPAAYAIQGRSSRIVGLAGGIVSIGGGIIGAFILWQLAGFT